MATSHNLNPDGNDMSTPVEPGTLTEGYVTETMDGQTMATEASDRQNVANDGQIETMTTGEVMAVASGDHTVSDEQSMIATAAEEATMVVDVDPTCPLSAFLSADEAVLSPSSGTPMKSMPVTPLTPRRDFLSSAESSPAVSGPGSGANKAREASVDHDMDMGLRRKVVGRRLAVVEDDGETQASRSTTSADEDVLTASSYKARNKGIKRGRGTEKDKDRRYERRTEEGSSEERNKKKRGRRE